MKAILKQYFDRYISISEKEFERFFSLLEVKKFDKKAYLLELRKVCKHRFFLVKGLTRSYYIDHNGNEKIIQFGIENWWVTQLDSFINGAPSELYIQALEPTTTLMISKVKLEQAYVEIPIIERLFRLTTENWLIAQQRNSHFFMKADSKERYYHMVNTIPNFAQRVPQYMIASYLDITPEYLSEIRKNRS